MLLLEKDEKWNVVSLCVSNVVSVVGRGILSGSERNGDGCVLEGKCGRWRLCWVC